MNTTYGPTQAQLGAAQQIITDIDALDAERALTNKDYYAVWGLAHAVLNTPNRLTSTYTRWINLARNIMKEI